MKRFVLLKVVSTRFLLVCFLSLKESTFETFESFLFSLQKFFPFSRKSNRFQLSWRHQMLKHKTRNTTCWITWSKHSLLMKCHIVNEKITSKNSTNTAITKIVPGPFVFAKIKHNLYWKINFLKQATYIRYILSKLSKSVQISTLTSSDSFLQRIAWKSKRAWN